MFVKIKGYSKYRISKYGCVWSDRHNKSLKVLKNENGYHKILLINDINKRILCFVHELVAKTFLDNKNGREKVCHLDGDRSNNYYKNLEFVSRGENIQHSSFLGPLFYEDYRIPQIVLDRLSYFDYNFIKTSGVSTVELAFFYKLPTIYIDTIKFRPTWKK